MPRSNNSSKASALQGDLFSPVLEAYSSAPAGQLANEALYDGLGRALGVEPEFWEQRTPVGASAQPVSLPKRRVRWLQQTMRQLGLLERTEERGVWRVTGRGRDHLKATRPADLTEAAPGQVMLGFSTRLGIALWGNGRDVFSRLDEPIHLLLSSPPYPLQRARAYGNPDEREFSDWICWQLEPIVRNLALGGSVVLNISNDIFMPGSPARSLYLERSVLDLHARLGLHLMDRIIWENPSKPPGPTRWACVGRQQLVHTWEPCLWFTNSPADCFADNRRVLREHSPRHDRLVADGGERRTATYGDGAHRLRPGSFGNQAAGSIPRNILRYSHTSREVVALRAAAQAMGLPAHGALMPKALARSLIEFLTLPDHLVADNCGGWGTTARAAEEAGRRWVITEKIAEYVAGSSLRFRDLPDYEAGFEIAYDLGRPKMLADEPEDDGHWSCRPRG